MNSKISRRGNKRMLFFVFMLGCIIFCLWYFFHPLSPYNERLRYVAAFSEVGPLANGSNVKIGGLPKGRILGMHKTDSCIYVAFEIGRNVRLAKDSKIHFASAGFLGNREILIKLGESPEYYRDGDTIRQTLFDKGLNTAKADLDETLATFEAVMKTLRSVLDSAKDGSGKKHFDRIVRKGATLKKDAENDLVRWKTDLQNSLDSLDFAMGNLKTVAGSVASESKELKNSGEEMFARLDHLRSSAQDVHARIQQVVSKLDENDNSAALVLQKDGEIVQKMEQIRGNMENMMKDIKKNGIKLNVDIF